MPPEVVHFISNNGYWAIFLLVFSQEVGLPNPVPNELVMLFGGYLAYNGVLVWPYLIIVVLAADFIGTNILYFTFYYSGAYIMRKKPRWFPLSSVTIEKLSKKIEKRGRWLIYILRLTPFVRGYTSVISGLLQVKPRVFLMLAFLSAATWSTFYISSGRLLGPYINYASKNLEKDVKMIILIFALVLLGIVLALRFIRNRQEAREIESGS